MVEFTYFADPLNFAYLSEDESECELCHAHSRCFDGDHFYGTDAISAVCPQCLRDGALIERDISANDVDLDLVTQTITDPDVADELTNEIIYRTPHLPTWQDQRWPFVDGQFGKFIKIASKVDFGYPAQESKARKDFTASLLDEYRQLNDPDWLWTMLPDHPITSLKDGNYDLSVYLFMINDRKICTWDAN